MCKSYKIEENQSYITSIEPLTDMNIAHHMFAYGCERPAINTNTAWMCRDVCDGEKSILFAWGRNAPSLNLPQDVAFKIGSDTKIRYIVINIHYLAKVNNDQSGLSLTFSDKP
jgi:peptidylglycine monooxygenase